MGKVATEDTVQKIYKDLHSLLQYTIPSEINTLLDLREAVSKGVVQNYVDIGDTIDFNIQFQYTQGITMPMDVISLHNCTDSNNQTKPGLWLLSHRLLTTSGLGGKNANDEQISYAVPFDAPEAFCYFVQKQNAGTNYSITLNNQQFYFTNTKAIPAGGILVLGKNNAVYSGVLSESEVMSQDTINWSVYSYFSNAELADNILEKISLSTTPPQSQNGFNGINFGALSAVEPVTDASIATSLADNSKNYILNDLTRSLNGYNRWSQSLLRQWLNSKGTGGSWWRPQNIFDRPSTGLQDGFLNGLSEPLLNIIKPIKVQTYAPIYELDSNNERVIDITYDRFFIPSSSQLGAPRILDSRGEVMRTIPEGFDVNNYIEGQPFDLFKIKYTNDNGDFIPTREYSENGTRLLKKYSAVNTTTGASYRLRNCAYSIESGSDLHEDDYRIAGVQTGGAITGDGLGSSGTPGQRVGVTTTATCFACVIY